MTIFALTLACSLASACTMTAHSTGAAWCEAILGPAAVPGVEYVVVEGVGTADERRCVVVDDDVIDPITEEEYLDMDRAIEPLIKGAK